MAVGTADANTDRVEAAVRVLRDRGERVTTARRELLSVFATSEDHLSAEDLVDRLAEVAPGVHRATVYRTLESLVRAGVVGHVHRPHGPATYHLVDPGDRLHLHLSCRGCGQMVDAPADLLDAVASRLHRARGFRLDADHVALTGWCRDCDQPRGEGQPAASIIES